MKNIIFDIGNVLVDFHPIPYFSSLLPNTHMEQICPLIFDEVWEAIDRGDYLCDYAKKIHMERYPEYTKQIDFIYKHWLDMMILYEEPFAFMKECKEQGYGIYLLSNIGKESHDYLKEKYAFFDLADGMVLSYEEHMIKPDPRIFECLLNRYNLQPRDCMFLDDNRKNVESACRLGIHGIVFLNCEQARKEVALC